MKRDSNQSPARKGSGQRAMMLKKAKVRRGKARSLEETWRLLLGHVNEPAEGRLPRHVARVLYGGTRHCLLSDVDLDSGEAALVTPECEEYAKLQSWLFKILYQHRAEQPVAAATKGVTARRHKSETKAQRVEELTRELLNKGVPRPQLASKIADLLSYEDIKLTAKHVRTLMGRKRT